MTQQPKKREHSRSLLPGSRGRYPYHDAKYLRVLVKEDVVYGDETGTNGDLSHVLVAGFVASPRQWERFDKEWRAILHESGIARFHSHEFFQRANWQSRRSPYYQWSGEQGKEFLGRLLGAIEWHKVKPVGGAVHVGDFNAQPLEVRQYVTGGNLETWVGNNGVVRSRISTPGAPTRLPYLAALTMLLRDTMRLARADTRINFILDENSDNSAAADAIFKSVHAHDVDRLPEDRRIGDLTWGTDDRYPGLQAADLHAYMWNVKLSEKAQTPFHRMALEALDRKGADPRALHAEDYPGIVQRAHDRITRRIDEIKSSR